MLRRNNGTRKQRPLLWCGSSRNHAAAIIFAVTRAPSCSSTWLVLLVCLESLAHWLGKLFCDLKIQEDKVQGSTTQGPVDSGTPFLKLSTTTSCLCESHTGPPHPPNRSPQDQHTLPTGPHRTTTPSQHETLTGPPHPPILTGPPHPPNMRSSQDHHTLPT